MTTKISRKIIAINDFFKNRRKTRETSKDGLNFAIIYIGKKKIKELIKCGNNFLK